MSKYIYGIIQTDRHRGFGPIGIAGGDEVYTVLHSDVAAVVSDSCPLMLTTMATEELVRHLFKHQSIIEKVMQEHTVIPLKFGTAADSVEEVAAILEKGYQRFKDALEAMQDKVEMDVVATWNKDMVLKDISQEEEIVRLREDLGLRPSMEAKVKLGQIVEALLDRKKDALAPEIVDELAGLACDFRLHDTPDASMVINVAFLAQKTEMEAFDRKLEEIDRRYDGRLNFKRIGPLPPYSFSTVTVKKAEFGEIDRARRILGLGEEATRSQVKETYWNLSTEYHPDKHPGDAEVQRRFEEISGAYGLLAEYCRGNGGSFREEDVRQFIKVDIVGS